MPGPRSKTCAACGRVIAPVELYYRFTLVLEGEQDVIGTAARPGTPDAEDELATLLKRLENGSESPQELEEQVHWERGGSVCGACRAVVVRTLSAPPDVAGPH
ncbi:hypothetical protein CYFUS_005034 [Cystobacter fuscus]|uniref:Uncharacterized protein n=1 Tax=Cystobacter fuscus TaxID=43 RepID=A0A250J6N5_9BACT|nr:hypothetical protein [Cystobacter fuscus]ATB39589.1 hypothetical protein CYFUS_005034 [Cystobacter fuscus]